MATIWSQGGRKKGTETLIAYATLAIALAGEFASAAPGLLGDFNGDGMVDAGDYTLWRNHFGESEVVLSGNGDSSGVVDHRDYEIWKGNFGTSSALHAAPSSTIPEPSSILLALTAVGLAGLQLRNHRLKRRSPRSAES